MRPPIVAIVGHIDHGKSTLLDYIRHTSVVAGEAGGITQHLSAYEAEHENQSGKHRITFLDTPGHEAFSAMRSRGLEVADVAILVVSAEEGVKPQTLEALQLIQEVKIPYIVALTKIDKPGANVEKAKMSLLEHQVFLEGLGGEVPYVPISGKTGEGIPELLDLILLAGELEGLSADPSLPGEGLVIEAHVDPRRGNTATLIVQNGSVKSGEYVVSGESVAPVRIMENFLGRKIAEALPGSPVQLVGFSTLPAVGSAWRVVETKKDAESAAAAARNERLRAAPPAKNVSIKKTEDGEVVHEEEKLHVVLPLIIMTDVAGTGEAVLHELEKIPKDEHLEMRITRGVGAITEGDVKRAGSAKPAGIIVGFNVKVEREARDLAERLGVEIEVFDIIYKLDEWLKEKLEQRRPRQKQEAQIGAAKVVKVFSNMKGRVVLGGRVEEGVLRVGEEVRLMRRDLELARGEIVSLQTGKSPVKKIEAGSEFGAQVKIDTEPAPGDRLEAFEVVFK
ncbi:MAG: translation initiation factor IF-2 [Patescibacteria group bacterium]